MNKAILDRILRGGEDPRVLGRHGGLKAAALRRRALGTVPAKRARRVRERV